MSKVIPLPSVSGVDPAPLLSYLAQDGIQAFLDRKDVTDICINRPYEVWLETFKGWERHDMPNLSFERCKSLAALIATFNGKHISEQKSTVSGQLPNRERVEIIMPPSCEMGTYAFTIRRPSDRRLNLNDIRTDRIRAITGAFVELSELEKELVALRDAKEWKKFIELAIVKKQNIIFAGPTGSGKTTFGKSFMDYIPSDERIITIEDVSEITLPNQPNHVHLFYDKDGQGTSKVTAKQLLQSSLRMKPNRILMAELRSAEAYDFFDSVNTGHPGSMTTVHANTPLQAFDRLAKLVSQSENARGMQYIDIKSSLIQSIDIIVQCAQERNDQGLEERNITAIYYDPEYKRQHAA